MNLTTESLSPISTHYDTYSHAERLLRTLRELTYDGVGVTRESYGRGEQVAFDLVTATAEEFGLPTEFDAAGNLFITLRGSSTNSRFVLCGSHLDSVPQGGNYDGAAGVVAGLVCLCSMRKQGLMPAHTIKVAALRSEESVWFGRPCIGSSALLGRLSTTDLDLINSSSGRTLNEAMTQSGASSQRIQEGNPLIDPASIIAYFELHIEQGPVLVEKHLPVGVVSGIRGNVRHRSIQCQGEAGHSGSVPRALRRDSVLATADLLLRLEQEWQTMLDNGDDLVFTTGVLSTDSTVHSLTRIPGEVRFSLDVRSQHAATLDGFYERFKELCELVGRERHVEFILDRKLVTPPVFLDSALIAKLQCISSALHFDSCVLPSGAGHDAAIFAAAGVPSAMIFVRNDHGSHNPLESMEMADFSRGIKILFKALLEVS